MTAAGPLRSWILDRRVTYIHSSHCLTLDSLAWSAPLLSVAYPPSTLHVPAHTHFPHSAPPSIKLSDAWLGIWALLTLLQDLPSVERLY